MQEKVTSDKAIIGLVVWSAMVFTAAALGGMFRPGPWFAELVKPSWMPPNSVFGPVWTVLYFLMAISVWLVWKEGGYQQHRGPLRLFLVQLFLNAAWSPLFFGFHSLVLSSVDIVLLWGAILATIMLFWKVKRLAALLLVPYLLWVTFATALNLTLWRLNS